MSQRAREEQARIEAEKLAEDRRVAREQALEWTREVRMDSDDEEKRPKRPKKAKADVASGDDEPKKRKKGKLKKSGTEQGEEDQAMFSEEDAEKPAKKVRNPSRRCMHTFFKRVSFSAIFQEKSGTG